MVKVPWIVGVVAASAFAAAASGCAIGVEVEARPVAADPLVSQAPADDEAAASTLSWMVKGDRLIRVLRLVPSPAPDEPDVAEVDALINTLIAGPTPAEARRGFSTALAAGDVRAVPTEAEAVEANPDQRLATVALSSELQARSTDQQVLAIGQVVLALTSNDFDAVVFVNDVGQPVAVPGPGSGAVDGPVTRSTYEVLAFR